MRPFGPPNHSLHIVVAAKGRWLAAWADVDTIGDRVGALKTQSSQLSWLRRLPKPRRSSHTRERDTSVFPIDGFQSAPSMERSLQVSCTINRFPIDGFQSALSMERILQACVLHNQSWLGRLGPARAVDALSGI